MRTVITSIDEQHRELFAKVNELFRNHQSGATMEDIEAV